MVRVGGQNQQSDLESFISPVYSRRSKTHPPAHRDNRTLLTSPLSIMYSKSSGSYALPSPGKLTGVVTSEKGRSG